MSVTSATFVVSQSTRFLVWVKFVVGNQLWSHSRPVLMWRQFPMSDGRLTAAFMQTQLNVTT